MLIHRFTQVSASPSGWGISGSRPTPPPSPLTTSTPAGLGKWAPPISKWAKPGPPFKAEGQDKPALRSQNLRPSHPPNRGPGPNSSAFTPQRGAPAPGKWSRPPMFSPPKPTPSTSTQFVANELIADTPKGLRIGEPIGRTNPRGELNPKLGESSRSFRQLEEDVRAARQPRRWEVNGKHKARGSLLSRREGDAFVTHHPRTHDVRTVTKPKVQKAKKSLRVNPDINIPSVVSVGNFARLLNVSMGMEHATVWLRESLIARLSGRLQRVMANAGMEEQSSYDYGV
jgi:hypothetical protein